MILKIIIVLPFVLVFIFLEAYTIYRLLIDKKPSKKTVKRFKKFKKPNKK